MNESESRIEKLIGSLQQALFKRIEKQERTNRKLINQVYTQMESLFWLEKRLALKNQLPPLRGWATSPDVLLKMHSHIIETKPKCIVEFGSGASTVVIADALRQNGVGKLYSFDNSEEFGAKTLKNLELESLENWVELDVSELVEWEGDHMNPEHQNNSSLWYNIESLQQVKDIDFVWVDGPPGNSCKYSRFPALPAVKSQLAKAAQVWMDDTIREEEYEICERWSELVNGALTFFELEKGLGVLVVSEELSALERTTSSVERESKSVVSRLDFGKK
ncbi:class I SAM-dependent methyltransferase [Alteromonas macleodii]|uniref:class I SAM-dependent methyltransferase n=1 Tax=Alteromonas macleodii TaxID=28108 RepID=UPI002980ABB5|nr:class I SAM-dependent methyltransferase [Alteromonas macleodii]MDW5286465.1 class I SAM-dependent methyltransferase [Alteromonas macleodii]